MAGWDQSNLHPCLSITGRLTKLFTDRGVPQAPLVFGGTKRKSPCSACHVAGDFEHCIVAQTGTVDVTRVPAVPGPNLAVKTARPAVVLWARTLDVSPAVTIPGSSETTTTASYATGAIMFVLQSLFGVSGGPESVLRAANATADPFTNVFELYVHALPMKWGAYPLVSSWPCAAKDNCLEVPSVHDSFTMTTPS